MLTNKNLIEFDDNKQEKLVLIDLCNVECVFASHNMINNIYGVCMLTTLVELNLSFNEISSLR